MRTSTPVDAARAVFAAVVAGYASFMDDTTLSPDGQGLAGGHDDEASASPVNDRHAEDVGGGTIPIEDEQRDPRPETGRTLQQENAETSLDQPSEG